MEQIQLNLKEDSKRKTLDLIKNLKGEKNNLSVEVKSSSNMDLENDNKKNISDLSGVMEQENSSELNFKEEFHKYKSSPYKINSKTSNKEFSNDTSSSHNSKPWEYLDDICTNFDFQSILNPYEKTQKYIELTNSELKLKLNPFDKGAEKTMTNKDMVNLI